MLVVAITGERQSALIEKPDPQPRGPFVVVRIEVAPMCTEYKGWLKGWTSDALGHEAAGTVVATDGLRAVKPGDRVVVLPQFPCGACQLCRQGEYVYCESSVDPLQESANTAGAATYAQFMVKQDWMLVKVPEDLSLEHASMANCALGPAFGAARRVGLCAEDCVLVTGLGPVGLGAVIVAKWKGARVLAVDPSPYRQHLARELGADAVLTSRDSDVLAQIRSLSRQGGVDKVLECAGYPDAQRLGLQAIRRLGSYAFVGEAGDLTVAVSDDFIRKGITVHGSWYYNASDTVPLMKLIRSCGSLLDRLITHQFPFREVERAWELQTKGECGKVLLRPWA